MLLEHIRYHDTMLLLLPEDILTHIFKHLTLHDIGNLIITCKTLSYLIINDNVLWRLIALQSLYREEEKLILWTNTFKRQSWYKNCRTSYNWRNGFFDNKVILQHKINFMPWIKFHNSKVLLVTVGSTLNCYEVKNLPNCNKLLWKLEVPHIVRNDIRTNDITRFILNNELLVCGNRDGSTAVYRVSNIKLQPQLIQLINDCHYDGEVEVTAVELVKSNQENYVVTASNDCSNIKFWCSDTQRENRDHQQCFAKFMDISIDGDEDIGVRCLAVNEYSNKLAIGPNGNNKPMLIDSKTGQLLITNYDTKNRKQIIRDINWHNENTVVYVTHSGYLQLLDVRKNEVVYTAKDPFQSSLYCVKTDGHRAIVAGSSEYARCVLYDCRRAVHVQMYFTQKRSSPVYSLDFNTSTLIAAVDRGISVLNFDVDPATTWQRDYSDKFQQ